MNLNQIFNRMTRMAMNRLVNWTMRKGMKGLDSGPRPKSSGPQRELDKSARQAVKRARQAARVTRRIGR
ncbi:hypothetical protein RM190_17620 [Paracoccus sp. CPCC 101403]|uniref:Uncharacterized protein n=1 Tax=Paracoccus broussonetiae TaxID=3075834 RepID=A0ABU3EHG4_9RHOB|nr:hypothetical protein [Paracoccus sp. CPCC 101403]MDT1063691.1 hypothetical protein [Paracoccus sp. CPCC 101403]